MSIDARYHEQVRLLVALLPILNDEPCFALIAAGKRESVFEESFRCHSHFIKIFSGFEP